MQIERCATSVADDMSVARDIARRFEQLETQVNISDSEKLEV